MVIFNKNKKVRFSSREKDFLEVLDSIISDTGITSYEREKLLKAKELFNKGVYFPNVVHRIDVTFRYMAMKSELSAPMAQFWFTLPEITRKMLFYGTNPSIYGDPL